MKQLFIAIAAFILVIFISLQILTHGVGDNGVKGSDALTIATHHTGYWVFLAITLLLDIAAIVIAFKKDFKEFQIVGVGLFVVVLTTLAVFYLPVNIKTDPISSGITTEEINYLKEKGLK